MLMYSGFAGLGWGFSPAMAAGMAAQPVEDPDAYRICAAEHPSDPAFFCSDYPGAPQVGSMPAPVPTPDAISTFFSSTMNPLTWGQGSQPDPSNPPSAAVHASMPMSPKVPVKALVIGGLALLGVVLYLRRSPAPAVQAH